MIRTLWPALIGLSLFCTPISAAPAPAGGHATIQMEGLAPNTRGGFTMRALRLSYTPDALSDPEATTKLHHRIEAAALAICRYNGSPVRRHTQKLIDKCRASVIHDTLARLKLPD